MILEETMKNSNDNIKRIINLMQLDDSVDAPADAILWSKNLFRTKLAEPKQTLVEKILAVLQVDLAPNKAVFGERSASAVKARQMLFEAGDKNSIDLRIEQTDENFEIKGQILGDDFANAKIEFGTFETRTNQLSEFMLEDIPGGIYNLIIRTNDKEIILENIELK